MNNRTFTIIKPEAMAKGYTGEILTLIEEAGFRIVALKLLCLNRCEAEKFYEEHKGKPFFKHLILYITSGPIIAAVLEKENAVVDFRKLIGDTNPKEARKGTIRNLYGTSKTRNAIHGSDTDTRFIRESSFFFDKKEIVDIDYDLPIPAEEIDKD
ncbi:MAG: nucleoside-diphosphate kinase [Odoribacter sp.]|nr:nucleoside-diphosphate kinase [Odoribacter sp.]